MARTFASIIFPEHIAKIFFHELQNHTLKVQSCKLYNNKYILASTQITNIEIFVFIAVLVIEPQSFVYRLKRLLKRTVKK